MKHVGIVVADRGSALVHVEHADDDELLVTAIERLPFDLSTVADRVAELDDELAEVLFVIDAEGLGAALWSVIGPPDDTDRWLLYGGRGTERQALVDRLLVAVHEGKFHFAPNLAEQAPMTKALQGYRRQVREDGVVGSELVVALLLALLPAPVPPNPPLVAWGQSPFRDDVRIGDHRLVPTPSGRLVGIRIPQEEE
jgi:hypothetical protein